MKTMTCCHCASKLAERLHHHPKQQRHRGKLGGDGEECGDRRRRAFIDVRRPHVERDRRNLEGQPGENEDDADQRAERDRFSGSGRQSALAMASKLVVPVKP